MTQKEKILLKGSLYDLQGPINENMLVSYI